MKIPKSLKPPRKLKKELKKGFTRNIHPAIKESKNPLTGSVSYSIHQNISYSGSNTKSFFRLCKYARKEEKTKMKLMYEQMARDILNEELKYIISDTDADNLLMGVGAVSYDKRDLCLKKFGCYPTNTDPVGLYYKKYQAKIDM